jgi:hypothetical protein
MGGNMDKLIECTANVDTDTLSAAATLIAALGSAITSIWGYYFVVIGGAVALIGALSATDKKLNVGTKQLILIALALFTFVNDYSLYSTAHELIELLKFMASRQDIGQFRSVVDSAVNRWSGSGLIYVIQPIGNIIVGLWIWRS